MDHLPPPRVFISHASEDKDRFVLHFAETLRANGIEVWLDKWELLPGDSLVDKIFEEGIKNAQAVIVILSATSVQKRWVREELNAALIRKINGISKLIPVIIDDCDVPEALSSTVWVRIEDLDNFDVELEGIVRAIFEQREKVPSGLPPGYSALSNLAPPGLSSIDGIVLKLAGEIAVKNETRFVIEVEQLFENAKQFDIPESLAFDSLSLLAETGYIEPHRVSGWRYSFTSFNISNVGFEEFAQAYVEDYRSIFVAICVRVINIIGADKVVDNSDLTIALSQPRMLIDHVLELLMERNLIDGQSYSGGIVHVFGVSTELRRMFKSA